MAPHWLASLFTEILAGQIMSGVVLIVMLLPLSTPISAGEELITRMRYPLPEGVLDGIKELMVPEILLTTVPIITGNVKLPDASDNCAVNVFPGNISKAV